MQLNHYCFICSIKNLKSSDSDFLRCIPDVHICSANGDINKKIQKKTKAADFTETDLFLQ